MLPGPHKIGPYVITGKIGSGGMATVYRAIHPQDGREVALKVLSVHLTDHEDVRKRFEREANTLLQFHHPHILPVYDFGQDDGTPYFAMRLMSGRSLEHVLRGHPLPIPEIGRFTRQIASALDYAHSRGIVHRDIKPANILLDEAGTPYLADFGIAYWRTAPSSGERLTQAGAFVGTVAYASPEQCEGKTLDRPSDIYSLAVLVFVMATGRLPFEASSPLAIIKMHLRDAPPNPLAFNPSLPMGLYNVLVKALAKLPEHRYPSAMKFSEAIDEALGLHDRPQSGGETDWLYGDIRPVSPDGLPIWITTDPPSLPTEEIPSPQTDPFGFDANADYGGPADPFADAGIEAVVERFSEPTFNDQFDLDEIGAGFADDFSDEAGLDVSSPPPALILGITPRPAARPSGVIRSLQPPPVQPAPRTPTLFYVIMLIALFVIAASAAALILRAGL